MATHTVSAELVGTVGPVTAAVGDTVEPADTLLLRESLKMEIPVLAEVFGVVTERAVAQGDTISEGDVIAVIEMSPGR